MTRNITIFFILFILVIQNSNAQEHLRVICPVTALSTDYVYSGPSDGMETITVTSNCTGYLITDNVSWVSCMREDYNVTIQFSTNFGPARTDHIMIGGLTLTVSQGCGNYPSDAGPITGTNSVCPGQTGVIYTVNPITNATGYLWSLPSGATISTGNNTNSITVNYSTSAVTGNISVSGTGCGTGYSSPNYNVMVNSIGQPGIISGNNNGCSGAAYSYSISPVPGASSYIWSIPSGWSGSSTSAAINVTLGTNSGTISVVALNSAGCVSAPASLPITVNYLYQYSVNGGGNTCPGVGIPVGLQGSTNGVTYKLYLNGVWQSGSLIVGNGGNNVSWNQSSPGNYTITGIINGCEVPMSGSANITNKAISLDPISIVASQYSECKGVNTVLNVNGGLLGDDANWYWYTTGCGGSTSVGSGASYNAHPVVTTTYYVRAEGTCNQTLCANATMTILEPAAIITQPVNSTIILNQDASFSVSATGTNLTYQWQSSPNGIDSWTNLTGLPAIGFLTPNLTIKGSTSFEEKYYRCQIYSCVIINSGVVKVILSFPACGYLVGEDPETRVLDTTYLVGSTSGSFNTNAGGGASYSIPLNAPPGVNGLSPNLSINYSSDGGSGIPGYGWQINGISSISLGPRTAFNDGRADGNCDRFYLDGQRLVPNKSSSVYGAVDTQYQTETDIFTRTTPQNVDINNGPLWFKSETKTGLVFEYGNTQSSKQKISNNSKVLNWYVSKISDQFGNNMDFTYIQDHYSIYPSEISYGPNQVTFYYKLRTDKNTSLSSGVKIEQWLLLDKIVIKYNSTVIKTYEFKYSYQGSIYNSYSILNEVIEYGIGANRLNSTVFAYQIPGNVVFTQTLYNQTDNYINYKSKLVTGDFNGDGKADFLCIPDPAKQATWTGLRVYFGDGVDNFANPIISPIAFDLTKLRDIRVMDLNSDGIDDILYEYTNVDPSKSDFNYILCNGTSLAQPTVITTKPFNVHTGLTGKIRRNGISQEEDNERHTKSFISPALGKNNLSSILPPKSKSIVDSDFDGDGINDVFINDPSGNIQIWTYSLTHMLKICDFTSTNLTSDILSGDYNGDGKTDIWSFTSTGLKIYTYISYSDLNYVFSDPWPTNQHYFTLGDFNADGKVDIFLYGYKANDGTEYDWPNWQIRLSNGSGLDGSGFDLQNIPQKKANLKNDNVRTGDFNGDGANDIMVNSKNLSWSGTYFYISTNSGTDLYTNSLPTYPQAVNNFYLADFNGDGSTDFICTSGLSTYWTGYQVYKSLGGTSILMNKIATGLGNLTKITYSKLSQAPSTIYQKDPVAAAFPVVDFQGPWSIVSSIQVDNGKGSMNTLNYYYMGAKVHLQGKGFIGYSKTMITDVAAAIDNESISSYVIGYYFYPTLLKTLSKRTGTTDTIEKVINKWEHIVLEYTHRRIFPYVCNSTHVNKLTGLSVTSSAQFDDSGNLTVSTTNYLNGPTVTTSNHYDDEKNDAYRWLLGRPTSTTIEYTGSSPTITRSGSRVFDQNSNNLTSETWFTGANQITKTYAYNTNGTFKNLSTTTNGAPRENSCTYMPDNVRIYTTTDQLYHITTNAYDSYGRLYTQQDYLGNTITHLYDNMGRESSITSNDGSQTSIIYTWEDPTVAPLLSRYSVQKTSIDGSQTKSWFDKLGRELRSGVKGFDGTMIYTSTVYNIKGQVESVSEPYYSGGTASLNSFLYDLYGRKTNLTRPSGRNTIWAYNNNVITETTAGKVFTKTMSADGTLASATDAGGTLTYTYYNDGKVKSITPLEA